MPLGRPFRTSLCRRTTRPCARRCARSARTRSPRTRPRWTRRPRSPQAAYDALQAGDFHAPHLPEAYGGVGADALATCIVIEEVARVCASSSLIPAVNKLGTMPLAARGLRGAQAALPAARRPWGGDVQLRAVRARGRAATPHPCSAAPPPTATAGCSPGRSRGSPTPGSAQFYTVLAVTDPDGARGRNVSAFVVERSDPGFTFGALERKLGIKGSPTRELLFDHVHAARRPHGRGRRARG